MQLASLIFKLVDVLIGGVSRAFAASSVGLVRRAAPKPFFGGAIHLGFHGALADGALGRNPLEFVVDFLSASNLSPGLGQVERAFALGEDNVFFAGESVTLRFAIGIPATIAEVDLPLVIDLEVLRTDLTDKNDRVRFDCPITAAFRVIGVDDVNPRNGGVGTDNIAWIVHEHLLAPGWSG